MELSARGVDGFDINAARIFQVMSNELSTPKIVWCPSDGSRYTASNTWVGVQRLALANNQKVPSYFLGINATEEQPEGTGFATPEELLRFDQQQIPPPAALAARLEASLAGQPATVPPGTGIITA